jgi:hypothetical protein
MVGSIIEAMALASPASAFLISMVKNYTVMMYAAMASLFGGPQPYQEGQERAVS